MTEQNTPHKPRYPRARVLYSKPRYLAGPPTTMLTGAEHELINTGLCLVAATGRQTRAAEAIALAVRLGFIQNPDGPVESSDLLDGLGAGLVADMVIRLMDYLVDREHNDEVGRVLMSFITGLMRRAPGLLGGLDMMAMVMGPMVPPMLANPNGPVLSLDELLASLSSNDDDQGDEAGQ